MTIVSQLKNKIASMIMSHETLITVFVVILVIAGGFGLSVMGARTHISPPVATNTVPSHNDIYHATGSSSLYAFLDTPAPDTSILGTSDLLGASDESINTSVPTYTPLPAVTPWPTPTPYSLSSNTTASTTTSNAGSCIGQPTVDNSQVYVSAKTAPVGSSVSIEVDLQDCNNTIAPVSDSLTITLVSGDAGTKINGSSSPVTIQTQNGKATFSVSSPNVTTATFAINDSTRSFAVTTPGYHNPSVSFTSSGSGSTGNPNCTTSAGAPNTWYSDVYPNPPITTTTGSVGLQVVIRDCFQNTTTVSDNINFTLASGDPGTKINGNSLPFSISAQNGIANITVSSQVNGTVTLVVTDTTSGFTVTDPNNHNPSITFSGASSSSPTSTPTPTPVSSTDTPTPTPTGTTTIAPTPTPTSTSAPTPTPGS